MTDIINYAAAVKSLSDVYTKLNERDKEFASSLMSQFEQRGYLSDKQMYWVEELRRRATVGEQARPAEKVYVSFPKIVEMLDRASQHLKFPKIRLQTSSGKPVVLSRAGGGSSRPGTVNVTDGRPYGDNMWYGRIELDGSLTTRRSAPPEMVEVLDVLEDVEENPADAAATFGHKTGACCFCRRELTDPRSTSVGYGPICADHFGLPWGEVDDAPLDPEEYLDEFEAMMDYERQLELQGDD